MFLGVLFGCFGRKMDGPGLLGGLIIHQGHLFPLKGRPCSAPLASGPGGVGYSFCAAMKAAERSDVRRFLGGGRGVDGMGDVAGCVS